MLNFINSHDINNDSFVIQTRFGHYPYQGLFAMFDNIEHIYEINEMPKVCHFFFYPYIVK